MPGGNGVGTVSGILAASVRESGDAAETAWSSWSDAAAEGRAAWRSWSDTAAEGRAAWSSEPWVAADDGGWARSGAAV